MEKIYPDAIKSLRKRSGMSQKSLSKNLGISNRAVSKWENGLSQPSAEHILGLSKIFHVPIDCFYSKPHRGTVKNATRGMGSIKEIYKIGRGPSSSHTIGPEKACKIFQQKNQTADFFKVILFGSLAKTGKGHGTDAVIKKTFSPIGCDIQFNLTAQDIPHPNTMVLTAYRDKIEIDQARVFSVGGGDIVFENSPAERSESVYTHSSFSDIAAYCKEHKLRLWEYVKERCCFPE